MKKNITLLIIPLFLLLSHSSCQKTDQINYNLQTTYDYDNVDNVNQMIRMEMVEELMSYAESSNTSTSSPLNAISMKNMYTNANTPFTDPDLNSMNGQLKDKVAVPFQEDFEQYMNALEITSLSANQVAMPNQAGLSTSNDRTQTFLLNENGVELSQVIGKGLAVACFYYQSTVVYLGETKMNVDNRAVTPGRGTNMEHHWDEAFAYFGAPDDFPSNTFNLGIWAEASNKVNSILGCNSKIMNAFLRGRAAISVEDYDTRDEARETIKKEWEVVLAAVAISYLNEAKENANDLAFFHHYLTEAYIFTLGLKCGPSQIILDTDIDRILTILAGSANPLQANFHTTTVQDIDETIDAITNLYTSLESVKTSL